MQWLFKEEPTRYSFVDLTRDRRARWSGVRNPLAQKHLREVRRGDRILYYHTGREKAVVGIARAASAPYPDPADRSGRRVAVDVVPVRPLARPVTLAAIKMTRSLASFPLVRLPRLSVMPVSRREWAGIETLSRRS